MNIGIYTITNIINGKIYVGSTGRSFSTRKSSHFSELKNNKHRNTYLQNSFNKYKEENFIFEILEECQKEYLIYQEQYWINILNTSDRNYGYNIISPIAGSLGYKHTEESRQLISFKKTGVKNSKETVENRVLKNRGKKRSDEQKNRIKEALTGRTISEEHRKSLVEVAARPEVIEKKRNSRLGKKLNKVTRKFEYRESIL